MGYEPGFYLSHLVRPELYRACQAARVRSVWVHVRPREDDYTRFGTDKWAPLKMEADSGAE